MIEQKQYLSNAQHLIDELVSKLDYNKRQMLAMRNIHAKELSILTRHVESEVSIRDDEITRLKQENSNFRTNVNQLEKRCAEMSLIMERTVAELRAVKSHRDAIMKSASWLAMAPYRAIADKVKNVFIKSES